MKSTSYYKSGEHTKNIKRAAAIGSIVSKENARIRREICQKTYSLNPTRCKKCQTALSYKRRTEKFCNKSCATSFNNSHKKHGTRRSKLEVYLEQCIKEKFPELEMSCNNKEAINSELDFYFPSLKVAIELNGIAHFKPIFGEGKLAQIQRNDRNKINECRKKQITLHVLDVSSYDYINKNIKAKVWNDIEKIVKN